MRPSPYHFFVKPEQIRHRQVFINGPDVVHLSRVLRLSIGDTVTVSDGQNRVYVCKLELISRDLVRASIIHQLTGTFEPPIEVVLLQGLPKADKLELVIQKGTELGVSRIIPLITHRTVVRLDADKAASRLARWQRIALEAAKQCCRGKIPQLEGPLDFFSALSSLDRDYLLLVPWEEERSRTLKEVLLAAKEAGRSKIAVLIGPEGGLTSREVELARSHGGVPVSLGPRILRTETAGLMVACAVLYELGDLGG
ncbi:MAG: 16S rRNA (uracil(1498)-N(3))-methyltransferase [Clostridia bacterium]|nr:16S rRNA (uracil(1498)-N(3))-methyltransferase [Clostridia bacterium]